MGLDVPFIIAGIVHLYLLLPLAMLINSATAFNNITLFNLLKATVSREFWIS
jgi:hypothetical protein